MAIPLTVNGAVFEYPVDFDENWGVDATGWAQAVTVGMLQMAGGSFPLTANVNFGPNFGLLSQYFSTRSANPATTGTVRLSSADAGIAWRNFANSANLVLTTNASNQLLYNGNPIASSSGGAVVSITGTANQIIASSATGDVTLSTPQDIAITSSPTFASLTLTAPLSVLNGGTGVTTSTGTGSVVLSSSPTLSSPSFTTPVLGTPSSGTLTNCTGLPIDAGTTGTLPVLRGGTGTTTSTGTGNVVLSNSPTLVTPALGTPSSATLTNATGLPLTTGVTGTLPIANGGTGQTSFATGALSSNGTTLTSGTLAVTNGGTGTTTSTGTGSVVLSSSPTLTTPALGTPSAAVLTNATGLPLTTGVTGTLPVANGGTGATSFTAYAVLAGGTTSTNPVQSVAGLGSTGQVLTSNGAGALPTFQNTAGSGTVNSGTANTLTVYAAAGTTVSTIAADTSAQNFKITSLANGTASADAAAFGQLKVIQIVTANTTTSSSSTSGTYADTGLSVSITPTSSSNKILAFVSQNWSCESTSGQTGATIGIRLTRTATDVISNDAGGIVFGTNTQMTTFGMWCACYIDSPATTSATTYKTRFARNSGTGTVKVQSNSGGESNNSTITLMEVVA